MITLTLWAKKNPRTARLIIGFVHLALAVLGLEGGLLLYALGMQFSTFLFFLPLAVFSAAYWIYPELRPGTLDAFLHFRRRKILDNLLMGSMAGMWLVSGNLLPGKVGYAFTPAQNARLEIPVVRGMLPAAKTDADDKPNGVTKLKWGAKVVTKWLSHRIEKKLKRYAASDRGSMAGLIVLGVLLTVGLVILIAWLSCSLACAGNEGVAILVVILGGGLLAGMWVALLKQIRKIRARSKTGLKV